MLGRTEAEKDAFAPDVAAAKPVHKIAREWVLVGGANGSLTFVAGLEGRHAEMPLAAIRPADEAVACSPQVTRPADVAAGVAEVAFAACDEDPDHPRSDTCAVAAIHPQLDHVADAEAMPRGPDQRVEKGEQPVCQAERGAPE